MVPSRRISINSSGVELGAPLFQLPKPFTFSLFALQGRVFDCEHITPLLVSAPLSKVSPSLKSWIKKKVETRSFKIKYKSTRMSLKLKCFQIIRLKDVVQNWSTASRQIPQATSTGVGPKFLNFVGLLIK